MLDALATVIETAEKTGKPFWQIVEEDSCQENAVEPAESFEAMRATLKAMSDSVADYDASRRSASGLVGGEGEKIEARRKAGRLICGDFVGRVMEIALKIGESNACMRRIVAAPTAGSCGVVPAVLIAVSEKEDFSEDELVQALFVAGGIGGVIGERAFLAGAAGGCQAEIGAASAMAAGALTALYGGDAAMIANAAALALKGLLGLSCDPVAGLVEVPCVKRNALGAVNAVTSADMTLAGIKSQIPPDEVIDAMRTIGRNMDPDIKETGVGGLAGTETGKAISQRIKL
ncbi:L-serine ammonia-lyase, iron-sulfur-dependent, subunit alpha [Pseudoramibacter sp.]|jgi:L-serine dehydratase|uniref:L-serine ammonia-lyase, iron-sulfur-dependent, subunit alpha n=1 Tax=Pseudoramibacter sp. TaxID=2034862 RepID=UPI0025D32D66|nr:L-serine ammonia-lyase, iron-sulfur-dependent, subunit alpha [Pseudoramibacter sp.]MCH4072332.1 L-serine ammonia-lyase, iron-sulfur-dependent, subunit alpha [Pseudoramibacter sp.]MCH4106103.1 L-serine ammonia-lyase, iron-sulfur-dependent, subunit alpha [Pseudoramibacter sp.]